MVEFFTRTTAQVADEVRAKFGDSTKVRLTDNMMVRWINSAFQEISRVNPWLEQVASCNVTGGVAKYDFGTYFPDVRIQRIDQVLLSGRKIELLPFAELMEHIANPTLAGASGEPAEISLYGGSFTLWPTPIDSAVDGLTIYFIGYPADIAEVGAATLTVPDRFYNAVVDYVHQQALEYDDNFEAADIKRGHFDMGMMREKERQSQSPQDFYPTVVDLDGDDFGPPTGGRDWRF